MHWGCSTQAICWQPNPLRRSVWREARLPEATADTGTFNMVNETLLLKGKKVVLSEGENVFVGCQLTVTMKTGEAKLDACGGRVMIQLDPKSRKQTN